MKTKLVVLLIAGALVLASTGLASALSIPGVPNGPTFVANRNADNGTAYIPGPNFTRYGEALDPDNPADMADVTVFGPRGGIGNEDTWGIFIMYRISDGIVTPQGLIDDSGFPTYYDNSAGTSDTWLVGMFYGGTDSLVEINTPGANQVSNFRVLTDDVSVELWAVEASDLAVGTVAFPGGELARPFDALNRTALNEYAGWLDATTKANGALLLSGISTSFEFNGAVDANGKFTGDSVSFWDIDETAGLWGPNWGVAPFFTDPAGNSADLYTSWELIAGTSWDTVSRDFGGVNVVPEPMTMLGMFLAVGSLGGYIRRRKTA